MVRQPSNYEIKKKGGASAARFEDLSQEAQHLRVHRAGELLPFLPRVNEPGVLELADMMRDGGCPDVEVPEERAQEAVVRAPFREIEPALREEVHEEPKSIRVRERAKGVAQLLELGLGHANTSTLIKLTKDVTSDPRPMAASRGPSRGWFDRICRMSERLTGAHGLTQDIARWREAAGTRAPPYHRLFEELVAILDEDTHERATVVARIEKAWASRTFRIFYDRPLLLLAAFRLDAILLGPKHPLWSAIGAHEPDPNGVTRAALLEALASESFWLSLETRFVQTNETSRAVAWLWPAEIMGCGAGLRPLALFEVGAAAGLNLVADRLPSLWTSSSGAPLPTAHAPSTVLRLGIDANPLDARNDSDASWLRACVWPGEHDRITRLEAGMDAFRTLPAHVVKGDVTEAPDRLRAISAEHESAVVIAFQTIVRDYLEAQTRSTYEREMRRWLEDSRPASAVWVELEIDHSDGAKRVPIVAHVREKSGVIDLVLGVTGYHPVTVVIDEASVARLRDLF
jgi:hypothetical protein